VPGRVGEPGLAAEGARVVGEQGVLGLDLVALALAGDGGHLRGGLLQDRRRRRGVDQLPHDQRQVVGRGGLAGDVQPRRRAGDGVVGADALGGGVHRRQRRVHPAGGAGQRVGRVVARLHDQRVVEQGHRVLPAGDQADAAALHLLVVGGALDDQRGVQHRGQGEQGQRLEGAGRVVAAVRVLRAEHLAAVEVGDHPAVRVDALGQGGGAPGHDQAAGVQPRAADGAAVGRGALGGAAVRGSGGGRRGRVHRRPRTRGGHGGRRGGQQQQTGHQRHRGRAGGGQQGSHGERR